MKIFTPDEADRIAELREELTAYASMLRKSVWNNRENYSADNICSIGMFHERLRVAADSLFEVLNIGHVYLDEPQCARVIAVAYND